MASDYTTNFNLDKYVGTDKPNLRDQYNSAMDKIDAQLKISSDNAALAVQTANNAASAVSGKASQSDLDALKAIIPSGSYSSSSTVKNAIDSKAAQSALNSEVTARQNADTGLQTAINNEITNRSNAIIATSKQNVVIIGDSYCDDAYDFSFSRYVNKGFNTCTIFGNGGAGFSHAGIRGDMNGLNFNGMVTYAQSHLPNGLTAADITDLAFVGGWNDGGHTAGAFTYDLYSAAINNARTRFPNAKIHVIYLYAGTRAFALEHANVRHYYKNWGIRLGVSYSECMNTIYFFDSPDNIHPTAGIQSAFLGGFVFTCIACGPQSDLEYIDVSAGVMVTSNHELVVLSQEIRTGETITTPVITSNVFQSLSQSPSFQSFWQGVASYGGSIGWDSFNLRVGPEGVRPQVAEHGWTYASNFQVFMPEIRIQLWIPSHN